MTKKLTSDFKKCQLPENLGLIPGAIIEVKISRPNVFISFVNKNLWKQIYLADKSKLTFVGYEEVDNWYFYPNEFKEQVKFTVSSWLMDNQILYVCWIVKTDIQKTISNPQLYFNVLSNER